MPTPAPHYDVVVMGGGPGGATLGALLARRSNARVAIVDRERFPREHIGESLSHRVIPVLEASGALGPVLDSDCWLKKHGGYYAWDPERPAATLFEHHNWEADGVHRWAIHCHRARFDQILLEHARACGVDVFEGVPVVRVERGSTGHRVVLGDGRQLQASMFVEASGRQSSLITGRKRAPLSSFRNVAAWTHVRHGAPAQSLPGAWNLFREPNLSPIGSFAFEDGWWWYIPVPRTIDGKRVVVHSLGLVTDPEFAAQNRDTLRQPQRLVALARGVPRLAELLREATPVESQVRTATNYSMVSEQFCRLDERWMLVGDAAYFVDPLFSSGVSFALHHAASASLALRWALEHPDDRITADLWWDYDHAWHRLGRSFALVIDQWYHAIAKANPSSVYWRRAARARVVDLPQRSFQDVVDAAVSPDLVRVLSRGSASLGEVEAGSPMDEARGHARGLVDADVRLRLADDVVLREGSALGVGRSRGAYGPSQPAEPGSAVSRYWLDPIAHGPEHPAMYAEPVPCMVFEGAGQRVAVANIDDAQAVQLRLGGLPASRTQLTASLSDARTLVVDRLIEAGLLVVETP